MRDAGEVESVESGRELERMRWSEFVQKANKATKCPPRRSARIGATTRLRAAQHNHEADTGLGCRMGRVLARALQRVGVLLARHRPQLRSHWPVQHAWATDRCGRPRAAHLCQRIGGLDICHAHETRLHGNRAFLRSRFCS